MEEDFEGRHFSQMKSEWEEQKNEIREILQIGDMFGSVRLVKLSRPFEGLPCIASLLRADLYRKLPACNLSLLERP